MVRSVMLFLLLAVSSIAGADEAPQPRFGVSVRETENNSGVHVLTVDDGSPASRMRRVADGAAVELKYRKHAITGFNGWRIRNSGEYIEAMAYAPKQCVFEVYDYEQKAWDSLTTELNGDPKPLPQFADVSGATGSPAATGGVASGSGGAATYYEPGFFGERKIATTEQAGDVTTFRGRLFNQPLIHTQDKGDRTEYYGPKFLWLREYHGSAEQQGDKTVYRNAWGQKQATAQQEGDRTVYRNWFGLKMGSAREENGRTVYRNFFGQKVYSADGDADPRRDGMIGIIREQKQQQMIYNSLW